MHYNHLLGSTTAEISKGYSFSDGNVKNPQPKTEFTFTIRKAKNGWILVVNSGEHVFVEYTSLQTFLEILIS